MSDIVASSRADFAYDPTRDLYTRPGGNTPTTTDTVLSDNTRRYPDWTRINPTSHYHS